MSLLQAELESGRNKLFPLFVIVHQIPVGDEYCVVRDCVGPNVFGLQHRLPHIRYQELGFFYVFPAATGVRAGVQNCRVHEYSGFGIKISRSVLCFSTSENLEGTDGLVRRPASGPSDAAVAQLSLLASKDLAEVVPYELHALNEAYGHLRQVGREFIE